MDPPICRFCWVEDEHPLLRPCDCKGTMAWAHATCVDGWRLAKPRYTCELCHQLYTVPFPPGCLIPSWGKEEGGWLVQQRNRLDRKLRDLIAWKQERQQAPQRNRAEGDLCDLIVQLIEKDALELGRELHDLVARQQEYDRRRLERNRRRRARGRRRLERDLQDPIARLPENEATPARYIALLLPGVLLCAFSACMLSQSARDSLEQFDVLLQSARDSLEQFDAVEALSELWGVYRGRW
jgi:hypothetical protein